MANAVLLTLDRHLVVFELTELCSSEMGKVDLQDSGYAGRQDRETRGRRPSATHKRRRATVYVGLPLQSEIYRYSSLDGTHARNGVTVTR